MMHSPDCFSLIGGAALRSIQRAEGAISREPSMDRVSSAVSLTTFAKISNFQVVEEMCKLSVITVSDDGK